MSWRCFIQPRLHGPRNADSSSPSTLAAGHLLRPPGSAARKTACSAERPGTPASAQRRVARGFSGRWGPTDAAVLACAAVFVIDTGCSTRWSAQTAGSKIGGMKNPSVLWPTARHHRDYSHRRPIDAERLRRKPCGARRHDCEKNAAQASDDVWGWGSPNVFTVDVRRAAFFRRAEPGFRSKCSASKSAASRIIPLSLYHHHPY
jgi:hypothetical protein